MEAGSDEWQAVERQAADRVLSALNVGSSDAVSAPARTAAAHEAYLEGRYHLSRFTAADTALPVAAFERALAVDASDGFAHAGVATASAQMYMRFGSEPDLATWKARAEQHAARAIQISPRLAEAYEALAAVARYTEIDWAQVIDRSLTAIALNPGLDLPHYFIASALPHLGRLDLVEERVVAGLEANPINLAEAYRIRGVAALWSGRFTDARTQLERVSRLTARPVADPHLALAMYYGGDASGAEQLLENLRGSARAEQRAGAVLASLRAARGDAAGARALVARVEAQRYRDHHVAYSLGAAYAGLGQPVDAMKWLAEARRTGFVCFGWYAQDPLLEGMRGQPEFTALIADMQQESTRVLRPYDARLGPRSPAP